MLFPDNFRPSRVKRQPIPTPPVERKGQYDQWGRWVNPVSGSSQHGNVYGHSTVLDSWGDPVDTTNPPQWL